MEAVAFEPAARPWKVIDPSVKEDFEGIAKLRDGDFGIVNRDRADKTWLVGFTEDRGPMRYYAWDRADEEGHLPLRAPAEARGAAARRR